MELPSEIFDSRIDSLPPAERRHTFGMPAPLSSNQSDFEMRESLSLESEDESGKHTLHSTGPENVCNTLTAPRTDSTEASLRIARTLTFTVPRAEASLRVARTFTFTVPRAEV